MMSGDYLGSYIYRGLEIVWILHLIMAGDCLGSYI